MIDLDTLLIFIPVVLALNLTPGADMLFCLGLGMRSGPLSGVAASIGVSTGALVHALAAGLGLAALLAANPLAFDAIRWAGVAYLIWLGVQTLRAKDGALEPTDAAPSGLWRAFRGGLVVNVLNPKVAIFVLALLPQFVDPARGDAFWQFMTLGVVLAIGGALVNGLVALFAGRLGRVLSRNKPAARGVQTGSGVLFLGLAAGLALERR